MMEKNMTGKEMALMTLVRPWLLMFTEPIVFLLNMHIGFVYALLYTWFEGELASSIRDSLSNLSFLVPLAFPLVFVDIHGFNNGQLGLAFMGIFVSARLYFIMV